MSYEEIDRAFSNFPTDSTLTIIALGENGSTSTCKLGEKASKKLLQCVSLRAKRNIADRERMRESRSLRKGPQVLCE